MVVYKGVSWGKVPPLATGYRVNLEKRFPHNFCRITGDCPFHYRRGRLAWQVPRGR